jgi:Holliday junction resolvase
MSNQTVEILKSSGAKETFSIEKLRESLRNTGAPLSVVDEVARHVEKELVIGMTTDEIYRHAFAVLRARECKAASRYSLRRSMLSLGPTGFPFEKFIAEIFKQKGFETRLDQTVQGRCVDHEVDVVAWNSAKLLMIEAKYHHELAYKSDVKAVLYLKSRFDDLREGSYRYGDKTRLDEGWLFTNTKFTEKAIQYAECVGMHLLGWNYPRTANLHHLIDETGLLPVSTLTTFSDAQKQTLMEKGVVLCQQVREQKETLQELGFTHKLIEDAIAEAAHLCPA